MKRFVLPLLVAMLILGCVSGLAQAQCDPIGEWKVTYMIAFGEILDARQVLGPDNEFVLTLNAAGDARINVYGQFPQEENLPYTMTDNQIIVGEPGDFNYFVCQYDPSNDIMFMYPCGEVEPTLVSVRAGTTLSMDQCPTPIPTATPVPTPTPAPTANPNEGITSDGFYYRIGEDGNATVYHYSGYEEFIVFPSQVANHPVTTIGDGTTFKLPSRVRSLTFPDGVTTIGDNAFKGVLQYQDCSVHFPQSIQVIGKNAFSGCSKASMSGIDNVKVIGEAAFRECRRISGLRLKNAVSIGKAAFKDCTSLTFLTISGKDVVIDEQAFDGAELKTIILNEGVVSVGARCFGISSHHDLEITLPASLTYIGNDILTGPGGYSKIYYVVTGSYAEQYCKKNCAYRDKVVSR